MKQKKTGIQEVADLAGVSITTVSRVINKISSVSEANRKRVEEVVRRLKFVPSPAAQALARGVTHNTISLVIPRYEGIFYSFYALELIRGIGTLCDALKLDLLLHLTDGRDALSCKAVSGIIFADIIGNRQQLEWALNERIPTVVINNFIEDLKVSCIAVDNFKGSKDAVNYLISLGHKKIAHIAGDTITQSAALRLEGYKEALIENKIKENPEYIIKTDYSRGEARQAAEKLLLLKDAPTAIFIASDSMALEVIAVIMEKGKKVPEDISVVGFDDNPSSLYGAVAITTVRQPLIKMAEEGVKELNSLINGKKELAMVKLPAELVIRDSCKAI
ncbi:MAG: LacI family DNA-binding transcriptional regulator [Candidatus Omnitrophota bacterium]|nr:LacI family DNA-binding transcriptional regulator [Candidatus Omnitrophota bacterium]